MDALATQPRPRSSIPYGSADARHLHIGGHGVPYIIEDDVIRIAINHLGRTI
ncbi:hypothetical protein ACH4A8_17635 [Streptomyces vietnamensis]|uniref:hypothetical protein n=1 Tax=Streptomyces vietnamensis TaxID=362257 RepID=UPI003797012B